MPSCSSLLAAGMVSRRKSRAPLWLAGFILVPVVMETDPSPPVTRQGCRVERKATKGVVCVSQSGDRLWVPLLKGSTRRKSGQALR